MKVLLILFLTIALYSHETTFKSNFGFLLSGTLLSNFKDARVAVKAWLEDVALQNNSELNVLFYEDVNLLYNDLKKEKLDMIVVDLPFFFKNKENISKYSKNFWSLAFNKQKHLQYYLISQKTDTIKNFSGIKNKTISIKASDGTALTWFDKNSLIKNRKPFKELIKDIKYEKKESTVLLNVFFRRVDYAIVTKKLWNLMIELNPSISKKLKIVKKSKEMFLPFIGLFRKNSDKKTTKMFFDLSKDLKTLKGSEKVIDLLDFDYIFKLNEKNIRVLENYYLEYFDLQKQFK